MSQVHSFLGNIQKSPSSIFGAIPQFGFGSAFRWPASTRMGKVPARPQPSTDRQDLKHYCDDLTDLLYQVEC